MSSSAFGAGSARPFDPRTDAHYGISEAAELDLRHLVGALSALGHAMDTPPGSDAPEVYPDMMAPVFHCLSRFGERVLDDLRFCPAPHVERRVA